MIKWRKGFLASIKSTAILVTAWELKMIDIHAAHTLKKVVVLQSVQYNLCNKTLDRTWTFHDRMISKWCWISEKDKFTSG